MATGKTYSFLDVTATLIGPGVAINLGSEAGTADEGITFTPQGQKNTMTVGADGSWMHSLRAGRPGTVTIRLLRTSDQNALLMAAYNAQDVSSSLWGKNIITLVNAGSLDTLVATGCAFMNPPDLTYQTNGGIVSWAFESGKMTAILGEYS